MKTIQVILERQIVGNYATSLTMSKHNFTTLLKESKLINYYILFNSHILYYHNEKLNLHIHIEFTNFSKPKIIINPGLSFLIDEN
jgi:hypothetical protein